MYISTCIHNKILSPILLWVWKIDLKLGCWPLIQHDFFKSVLKVRLFKKTDGHMSFSEIFMKIWKFINLILLWEKGGEAARNSTLELLFLFRVKGGEAARTNAEEVLPKFWFSFGKRAAKPPEPLFKKCWPRPYNLPPGSKMRFAQRAPKARVSPGWISFQYFLISISNCCNDIMENQCCTPTFFLKF